MLGSECVFEAVEQQDLEAVQILLYQYSAEELDLNTPNSQGLTPLDIAVMTNNTPIAKLLLKAGGKESPHCEYTHTHTHTIPHTRYLLCIFDVFIDFLFLFLFQMLSTVLNIIIFEDCRNQWSMSRPLLGLILLNEKVHTHTQNKIGRAHV